MLTRNGYTMVAVIALAGAVSLAVLGKPFEQTLAFLAVTTTLVGRGKA